jgi:hypothetical protein
MIQTLSDSLQLDVPVGDRLAETREILVAVDRVNEAPLRIRLRLVADECEASADLGAMPVHSAHDTPMPFRRLRRRLLEDYPGDDFGGSD